MTGIGFRWYYENSILGTDYVKYYRDVGLVIGTYSMRLGFIVFDGIIFMKL